MYKRKLCLGTSSQFGIGTDEQIALFKKTGFDAFFPMWSRGCDFDSTARAARENEMIIQSVHAPFGNSAHMWGDDADAGADALKELISCLECCAEYGVPIMVAHAFIGFNDHTPTAAGLERFGEAVKRAASLGVKIAFENTEGEEYLAALLSCFSGDNTVGFCWDSGHEMCYNRSRDLLALYGDRLLCTHLNDNLGIKDYDGSITYIDDLHLLPFDGIADWDGVAARLKRAGFDGILTFELCTESKPGRHENDVYSAMPTEQYISECYKRACRVAAKL